MQNLGFKPNINQFLANQTGYTGDFGSGGFSKWLQTQQGAPYAQQIQNYLTGIIPGQQRNQQLPGFNFGSMGAVNPNSINQRTNNYNVAGASLMPQPQRGLLSGGSGEFVKGGTISPQQQTQTPQFDMKTLREMLRTANSGNWFDR